MMLKLTRNERTEYKQNGNIRSLIALKEKSLRIPRSFSPFRLHIRTKLSAKPAAMREVSWEKVAHGALDVVRRVVASK
jgi:hypothetical protein